MEKDKTNRIDYFTIESEYFDLPDEKKREVLSLLFSWVYEQLEQIKE